MKIINIVYLIIILILIKIFNYINYSFCDNNILTYIEFLFQKKRIIKFSNFCKKEPKIIKKFWKLNNPKVSVISPIYNRERYILRLLKSIQSQTFQNLEIILIDDCSIDKSVKIIEENKKIDNRVKLIKNIKNKGTFISRNIGVLYSKGKYLIIPDPDDLISKNIINICYKYAEKNNYEIIRFNMYNEIGKITLFKIVNKLNNLPTYQPEIYINLFYGSDELDKIDYHICNKFIKKEAYIRALNFVNSTYLFIYIIYRDDSIINYLLYKTSKSYLFINDIGYYYAINSLSVTNNLFSKSDLRIKFAFIFLKIVFQYSKNTKYEKDTFNFLFTIFNKKFNINQKKSAFLNSPNYFYNIIKIYLNCRFLTNENKITLEYFRSIIKNIIK